MASPLKGAERRYVIGIDTPLFEGYTRAWPKARAIQRAKELIRNGGSAVVGREWHGVFEVVAHFYVPPKTDP